MTTTRVPRLKFKKNILSSPKESIPLKELLERLDILSTELSKIDQEKFDIKSLDKIKGDLVSKKLLNHKDPGVQALVACCLSDVLRVYAPDAPYTDHELTEIFKLFIRQFKKLSDQQNGYYAQEIYLITRLAEVRSIILVTVIDKNASLIESIFELFFDSNNKFNKRLEPIISDILIEIISEWDQITTPVLKLILNKFLTNPQKDDDSVASNLSSSVCHPFNFTLSICNANPDRLARQFTKFFSEVLFENKEDERSEVPIKNLVKLHNLCIEVWRYVPEVLGSVMGLIDDELNAENEKYRIIATETVGQILTIPSRINFVKTDRDTWINWLKKTLDISPHVRIKWVEQATKVLQSRSDISNELSTGISQTLIDSDEKVRYATTKSIATIPSATLVKKINNKSIINGLIQLTREKHAEIRENSISILAKLFDDSYDDIYVNGISDGNEIYQIVKQIPNHILNLLYINDKEINYLVDITLVEEILPFENDDLKRVTRILNVFQNLGDKAKGSFIAFNKRQQQLSSVIEKLIEFAKENNGENNDEELNKKIEKTISWLSVSLPERFSPKESLQRFININNRRLYFLMKLSVSSNSDYESIRNSSKEFFTRIRDPKVINAVQDGLGVSVKDIAETFKVLFYRSSLNFYNKSNISSLLKLNDNEGFRKVSQELIDNISTIAPFAFQNQISELTESIIVSTPGIGPSRLNTLRALFHIFRKLGKYLDSSDSPFFRKLVAYAQEGSPLEAKFAVKIISIRDGSDELLQKMVEHIYPLKFGSDHILTNLSVISQLFLRSPSLVEGRSNEITPFLIKEILLKNEVVGKDDDPSWIDDEDLENGKEKNLYAKILALKIFTNRLRSLAESDGKLGLDSISEHVLKLLVSFIGNGGEIVSPNSDTFPTPKHYQTRLRLEAGLNLLKLARLPAFNKLINSTVIQRLILLIQDENENVRSSFIHKLTDLLKQEVISSKFLPAVYFIAFEPKIDLKNEIKTWVKFSFNKKLTDTIKNGKKDIIFEKSLTGLIHLIAHHNEFQQYIRDKNQSEESLLKAFTFALEYIIFFLDIIATDQNISLLYYMANRVKQYRDALFTENDYAEELDDIYDIYRVSDLAQLTIRELQEHKGWFLQTYPGKIDLSSELFSSMKRSSEGQKIISQSFIPGKITKKLIVIIRRKISAIHSKRPRPISESSIALKSRGANKEKSIKKNLAKRRLRETLDQDEEDEEDQLPQEREPLRKSARLKRISYAAASSEVEDDGDEDGEDED